MIDAETSSFRDRESVVFYAGRKVLRALSSRAREEWDRLRSTRLFAELTSEGRIVRTNDAGVEAPSGWAHVLEHERVRFISYPYEWPFGMLREAALLQLEILARALAEGMILKDSTPYNVQWFGSRPVFIDIASFEQVVPGEPWRAYRQFCELFLNPLLIQAYRDVDFQQLLRGRVDGISVRDARQLLAGRTLFRSGVLSHVWLHSKLERQYASSKVDQAKALRGSGFATEMICSNVKRLRQLIEKLEWKASQSVWSEYETTHSYAAADREWKERFVRETVASRERSLVWDLGCNTGTFSRIAAEQGAYVIAVDADHLAVERLFRRLRHEGNERILPLVMNLADPSPSLGWRGAERRSLDERGKPDLVLALALIHHLVISANVPLLQVVDWLASLGGDLVIEFVRRNDAMVETLLRGKRDNYDDYDEDLLARLLGERWQTVRREVSGSGTRVLFAASRA
jgi:SAM-dependent methyltransferase